MANKQIPQFIDLTLVFNTYQQCTYTSAWMDEVPYTLQGEKISKNVHISIDTIGRYMDYELEDHYPPIPRSVIITKNGEYLFAQETTSEIKAKIATARKALKP